MKLRMPGLSGLPDLLWVLLLEARTAERPSRAWFSGVSPGARPR